MGKLKILQIITKLELGGAQEHTLHIASHLDPQRFESFLIAGPGGLLDDEARSLHGVTFRTARHLVRRIDPVNDFLGRRELRTMIREIGPDIVHTNSSKAGILGRLAAADAKVPVIIHTIHGFGIEAVKNRLLQRVLLATERAAARVTTHFIGVARQNILDGIRFGLLSEDRASVIYSGVDLTTFRDAPLRPELLDSFGFPRDAFVIGSVSCFKPQKDPLAFVDVAAAVHAEAPETRFLLIGDGELRPAIQERIREYGLEKILILTGWRRDVPELLKLLKLSILTSRWEGLPRVIPESLSAGVPVVVTRAGGSAEAVREGETGYVVEHGDWNGMAERILAIVRDPARHREMSARTPESVTDWEVRTMVRRHEALYERLAGGRSA